MSPGTTTTRRWRPLLGPILAVVLTLGAALAASGASRGLVPAEHVTALQSAAADCRSITTLVSAAVTATSSTGTTRAVTAARSRATTLADATASDSVRELAQNLADDLAAYRTALTTVSNTSAQRHTDISATIHGDITALRMLCGG